MHVVEELVHLVLPARAAGDARVPGEMIERLRVPVGVEADAADRPRLALGDRLGDGVGAAGRVLAQDDGDRPGLEHLAHLVLDRGLRRQDVLRRLRDVDLGRDRGVAVIDDAQMLEDVEVEVLDVARAVAHRLLAHPFRPRQPVVLVDPGVLLGVGGNVRRADDHGVGALELGRRGGVRQPHEARRLGRDHRELAAAREARPQEFLPTGIGHRFPPLRRRFGFSGRPGDGPGAGAGLAPL